MNYGLYYWDNVQLERCEWSAAEWASFSKLMFAESWILLIMGPHTNDLHRFDII